MMLHFLRYVLITVYLFRVNSSRFFDLFEKYNGHITGRLKLKRPKQLQEVLDVARFLIADPSERLCEKPQKLDQLKTVLEMYVFLCLLCCGSTLSVHLTGNGKWLFSMIPKLAVLNYFIIAGTVIFLESTVKSSSSTFPLVRLFHRVLKMVSIMSLSSLYISSFKAAKHQPIFSSFENYVYQSILCHIFH